MKQSDLKKLIKMSLLELLEEDRDVFELINEIANNKVNNELIEEEIKKEPSNPELYDQLVLVAAGKRETFSYNKKRINAPNYGVGFKSPSKINEWAKKAYDKFGGEWERSETKDAFELSEELNRKNHYNQVIKNNIKSELMLDHNFQPIDQGKANIYDEILAETAATTLKNFPKGHPIQSGGDGMSSMQMVKEQESFHGKPEDVFGKDSANRWAALAFQTSTK